VALLEAMAAAKPIIATSVSGTAQVLSSGVTGLLVPPGDSQMLSSAILQLLADPDRAREMGMTARQHVKVHFGAQKQAAEHLALYRSLLRGAARP
jgi:glycosyltransferase involved in cell wall biosynthesis